MRRPVKYRCINCKRQVREGERHNYVRCVSGTSWWTRAVDWLGDHGGQGLAVVASIEAALAAKAGLPFLGIALLAAACFALGHHIDSHGGRRG